LIQGFASALRHQLFEHASHSFYSIHQIIQLRKLSLERSEWPTLSATQPLLTNYFLPFRVISFLM
jgi:hypothetical protein